MTVFYEIAMCMLRSIFHKLLCISTFFYGALYMNCVQHFFFFLAFLNIASLFLLLSVYLSFLLQKSMVRFLSHNLPLIF